MLAGKERNLRLTIRTETFESYPGHFDNSGDMKQNMPPSTMTITPHGIYALFTGIIQTNSIDEVYYLIRNQ